MSDVARRVLERLQRSAHVSELPGEDEDQPPPRLPRFGDPALNIVWNVLNRSSSVDAMVELRNGLNQSQRRPAISESNRIAFGFDTNAIYRVGLGKKGPDAIDYLRTRHD